MLQAYADHWALITGASSGIGAEFARQLAARGMHLVLSARREQLLTQLAGELHQAHGTKTEIIIADLSNPHEPARLLQEIEKRGVTIELLVNNAGFGIVSEVEKTDVSRILEMIQVNVAALSELTLRVLPGMLARGHGGIINVASVAAFQPVGYMGAYAATKAYVLHFSEALWAERENGGHRDGLVSGLDPHRLFQRLRRAELAGQTFRPGREAGGAHGPEGARKAPLVRRFRLEKLHSVAAGADRHAGHRRQRIDEVLPVEDLARQSSSAGHAVHDANVARLAMSYCRKSCTA